MTPKQAIIFGGNGQDGSYLSEYLLELGYRVTAVGRRSSIDNTERLHQAFSFPQFYYVEGDITDPWSVASIISEHGTEAEIYNLAAQSHVGTSFNQPQLTWDVTAGGCLNCLEAIRMFAPKAKFYQASSSEMFGSSVTKSFDHFQDENTPFAPQSPYAIAKLAAHQMVACYRKAYEIHASCGILFNHESPRRGDNFVTKKITNYLRLLKENANYELGSSLPMLPKDFPKLKLGNLEASRDWGHAQDYIVAMHAMLQMPEPDDYVIATGETHTVREFLYRAFLELGIDDWHQFVEIDPTLFRPAEVPYLRGRYEKAHQAFGWEPTISFTQLVKDMVNDES